MKNKKIRILSTRPVDSSTVNEAVAKGIQVDVLSFIETIAIKDNYTKNKIDAYAAKQCVVIFTSMNAVDAVATHLDKKHPEWKIFCMGNSTRQVVENYFGKENIISSASNATALADEIIAWKKTQHTTTHVVFFCGDQRRDELPEKLKQNDIEAEEIITYKTIETTPTISHNYDGILFFSPSAVHSFFKTNKAPNNTVFFAIGETTANTIKDYSVNKIVISKTPAKDELLKQAVEWLGGEIR